LPLRPDRRAPVTPLARRIAARLREGASVASFSLATAQGRVHVCVRKSAGVTRVFALCPPAIRVEVEAALAQARFMFAAGGGRVQ
jgi:hypothetical protein